LLSELLFNRYADFIFPGFYFVSEISLRDNVLVHAFYLAASTMIVLSGGWFRESEHKQQITELEKEKIHTELQMLKNQVNPHFFFNTLQSLYALALKKSDELPGMILKLSDLMRYVIYEADTEKIEIQKEISFIENYLELQKLRLTKNADLRFEVGGTGGEVEIIPLLLIHFVENCFKHGLKGEAGKVFAHIALNFNPDQIIFTAVNNQKKANQPEREQTSGSGLENVRRRLDLHYSGRYDLKINSLESSFEVKLKINL
jgi:LytS/YehU family sensor histidine kinase